jgi:hypothetical protein
MACWTYLDVHQVLHAGASEFWKLHAALAQKCRDVIAFFALRCSDTWKPSSRSVTHLDGFAMTAPIPEGISDLDSLGFYPLLLRQPFLADVSTSGFLDNLAFLARFSCLQRDTLKELTFLQHQAPFLTSVLAFLVIGK